MTLYPQSIDDIDAAWLSDCLATRFPGSAVTRAKRGRLIRGTATKIEYELEYNEIGRRFGLPRSLWIKCGLDTQIPEQSVHSTIEALFYRDLAHRIPCNVPRSYATTVASDGSSGIVLHEDLNLRPVRFGTQGSEIPAGTIEALLSQLAGLHAAFWRSAELRQLGWLKPGGIIHSDQVVKRFMGFWDHCAQLPRFTHVPSALRDRAMIERAIMAMLGADMADPICLVHGDPHVGNLFFDVDGKPDLLDWATVMHGHWAWDVAYAMIVVQTPEERRNRERGQLRYYLDQLASHGVSAPDFGDAWQDYARHAIWPFLFALCPAELQPEELCIQSAERASAAIVDLRTIAALLE